MLESSSQLTTKYAAGDSEDLAHIHSRHVLVSPGLAPCLAIPAQSHRSQRELDRERSVLDLLAHQERTPCWSLTMSRPAPWGRTRKDAGSWALVAHTPALALQWNACGLFSRVLRYPSKELRQNTQYMLHGQLQETSSAPDIDSECRQRQEPVENTRAQMAQPHLPDPVSLEIPPRSLTASRETWLRSWRSSA